MQEVTGLIEDWAVLGTAVRGIMFGDIRGRFPDGFPVKLSRLEPPKQELKTGARITTLNSVYILGREAGYHAKNEH